MITKYLYIPGIPLLFGLITSVEFGLLLRLDSFTAAIFACGIYVSSLMILLLIEHENTGNDEWVAREEPNG